MNYNRIKELLVKKGHTSNELAAFMDVNRQTVSTWCRNIKQPEIKTLFRIAEFLKVDARELLTEQKDLVAVKKKAKPKKKKTAKKGITLT